MSERFENENSCWALLALALFLIFVAGIRYLREDFNGDFLFNIFKFGLFLAGVIFIGLEIYVLTSKNYFYREEVPKSFGDFIGENFFYLVISVLATIFFIPISYSLYLFKEFMVYEVNWPVVLRFLVKWGTIIALVVGLKYYLYYKFVRGEK